jgi:hypothetical protein
VRLLAGRVGLRVRSGNESFISSQSVFMIRQRLVRETTQWRFRAAGVHPRIVERLLLAFRFLTVRGA